MKGICIVFAAATALSLSACALLNGRLESSRVQADPADTADYGRVYGEFQDASLYRGAVGKSPEMADWSDRDICDGLSGATLQAKTLGSKLGDRIILLDGKKTAFADGFGQFWLSVPEGTYTLTGRCRGYADASVKITVEPRSKQWVNLYLEKK
jgi:hypothetical protein